MLNTHQRWSLFGQFAFGFIWLYSFNGYFFRCAVDRHIFTRVLFFILLYLFFSLLFQQALQKRMKRSICRINHNNNHWNRLLKSLPSNTFLWVVVKRLCQTLNKLKQTSVTTIYFILNETMTWKWGSCVKSENCFYFKMDLSKLLIIETKTSREEEDANSKERISFV